MFIYVNKASFSADVDSALSDFIDSCFVLVRAGCHHVAPQGSEDTQSPALAV